MMIKSRRSTLLIGFLVLLTGLTLNAGTVGNKTALFPVYLVPNVELGADAGRFVPDKRVHAFVQYRTGQMLFTDAGIAFAESDTDPQGPGRTYPELQDSVVYGFVRTATAKGSDRIEVEFDQPLQGKVNILRGPESQWKTGIPTYGSITYKNVWPNIDLRYDILSSELKQTIIAHPGSDLNDVCLRVGKSPDAGVDNHVSKSSGDDRKGDVRVIRSVISDGDRDQNFPVTLVKDTDGTIRISAKSKGNYAKASVTMTSDWTSFISGGRVAADFLVEDMACARENDVTYAYVVGYLGKELAEAQASFPGTAGSYDPYPNGHADGFLLKMNESLSEMVFFTYMGGSGQDIAKSVDVGPSFVAVGGHTYSQDFPTTDNAYDSSNDIEDPGFNTSDCTLCALSLDGTTMLYSSYFGGWFTIDVTKDLKISDDKIYAVGESSGSAVNSYFPRKNAYQSNNSGLKDLVVFVVDPLIPFGVNTLFDLSGW